MKHAFILVAIIVSPCCGGDPIPSPTPLSNTSSTSQSVAARGSVWVLAVDPAGFCVESTAEVIAGQKSGETLAQKMPCDAWSYDGGFYWGGLAPGEPMTIRVSAPSRVGTERTLTPQVGTIRATVIELPQEK
jgi:hypothetical protein